MFGELKEQYLKEISTKATYDTMKSIFNKIAPYEEAENCDFCQMNQDQLYTCLKVFSNNKATFRARLSYLTQYLEWCRGKGYLTINWLSVEPANILFEKIGITGRTYLSPEELGRLLSRVRAGKNGVLYETFLRCLYEGVEDGDYENLDQLRLRDVNWAEGLVKIQNGKELSVSGELLESLRFCESLSSIENELRPTGLAPAPFEDSVFKNASLHSTASKKKFTRYMSELSAFYGVDGANVRDSGLFFRVCTEARREGYDVEQDLGLYGVISSKGDNKEIAYGRILYGQSVAMSFKQFQEKFVIWKEYAGT